MLVVFDLCFGLDYLIVMIRSHQKGKNIYGSNYRNNPFTPAANCDSLYDVHIFDEDDDDATDDSDLDDDE